MLYVHVELRAGYIDTTKSKYCVSIMRNESGSIIFILVLQQAN